MATPPSGEVVKIQTYVVAMAEKKSMHLLDRVDLVSHVSCLAKVVLPETPALPFLLRSDKSSLDFGMVSQYRFVTRTLLQVWPI